MTPQEQKIANAEARARLKATQLAGEPSPPGSDPERERAEARAQSRANMAKAVQAKFGVTVPAKEALTDPKAISKANMLRQVARSGR